MSPETAAYPSDAEILQIDDSPEVSNEASETSESTATIETQPETTETESPLSPEQTKPETLAQPKQQTDKTSQPAKEGTPEQAQEVTAQKAAELDRADAAFSTGDVAGMAETFEQMFGENPAGLTDAMWMGYRFLEQRSPEQFAQFAKMILSDQLAQSGVTWETLTTLAKYLEQAGDRKTFDELNKLSLLFKQSGHGPSSPETQGAAMKNYSNQIGEMLGRSVPMLVRSTLGERFNSVAPYDQAELLKAADLDVMDLLAKDQKLATALQSLNKKFNNSEGVRIWVEILAPRLRQIVPLVTRKLANENRDLFRALPVKPQTPKPAQPATPAITAPRSMAEARSRGMTMADILKATEGEIASGSFLSQEEADGMSEMDVLSSRRVPLTKKPWQPGNELDQL